MINFKQFVSESNIKRSWSLTPFDDSDVDKIKKYCSQALRSAKNGHFLFKGFGSGEPPTSDFALINTSSVFRTSRDTNNLYQLMMDNSINFLDYPKRSNSLICTSNYVTARNYGKTYIVLPFDNTPIAKSNRNDYLKTKIQTPYFVCEIAQLNDRLDVFLKTCGIKKSSSKYTDVTALDTQLAMVDPGTLMLKFYDAFDGHGILKFPISLPDSSPGSDITDKMIIDHINAYGCGNSKANFIFSIFKSDKPFTNLCSILTPKSMDVQLITPDKLESNGKKSLECWFSGNCFIKNVENREMKNHFIKVLKEI